MNSPKGKEKHHLSGEVKVVVTVPATGPVTVVVVESVLVISGG